MKVVSLTVVLDTDRLHQVLVGIANSTTDNPDVLRMMASRAIFEEAHQDAPCSLEWTLERLDTLSAETTLDKDTLATTRLIIVALASTHVLPRLHPHGVSGNLMLSWDRGDQTVLLIVKAKAIELQTFHKQRAVVNIAQRSYTGGSLPPDIAKYIPTLGDDSICGSRSTV